MMKKFLIAVMCFGLVLPLPIADISSDVVVSQAQAKGGRSSSRSYSRPSSSRPSSRPSYSRPSSRPSSSKPSYSRPSTPSSPSSTPSSKPSYSRPSSPSYSPSRTSSKPKSNFDSSAGKASAQQSSKVTYKRATTPSNSYTKTVKDPKTGKTTTQTVKIDRNSSSAKQFSGSSYTADRYASRHDRQSTVVYNNYYGRSYPSSWGYYNDGISPYFWLWMMSLNSQQQASYIHNHSSSLDQARLNELYAKNAQLQAEVNALKDKPVDPNYVPAGMDASNSDLMYSDDYVAAASGYQAVPAATPKSESWGWFTWLCVISVVGLGIYFVFFYRRGARGI